MIPAAEVFVTVLGEVNRPGVIPFQYGLTVSDYLLRAGGPTREADLGLVHFVDKTGRILRHAPLDAPVATGDILIVERQVILRLLEGIQRIAPIISLFNQHRHGGQHRQHLDRPGGIDRCTGNAIRSDNQRLGTAHFPLLAD